MSERRPSLTLEESRLVVLLAEVAEDPTGEVLPAFDGVHLPALVILIGVIMHVCGY